MQLNIVHIIVMVPFCPRLLNGSSAFATSEATEDEPAPVCFGRTCTAVHSVKKILYKAPVNTIYWHEIRKKNKKNIKNPKKHIRKNNICMLFIF